ncbi:Zinc metalloproteinase nas-13 [Exaiptasia diaphana]|nr:Zinc metalloproteinase nas-13 [Exaiptasia diaphana]
MDSIEKANEHMSEKDKKDAHIFEGDIELTSSLEGSVDTKNCSESENANVDVDSITNNSKRKAIRSRLFVWRSRTVPIEITQEVANEKNGEKNVWDATKEIEKNTCVKFRKKRSGDKYWIKMFKGGGCFSKIGRQVGIRGGQPLSIGPGCNSVAVILHELLHALGFWHEQSRTDRDKYVNILWENIVDNMRGQFNKYEAGQMDMVGGMYDFDSVMHYGNYAFSKNRKPTMLSIKDPNLAFGRYRPTLSKVDIVQINSLYNCKTKSGSWSSWTGWGPCDLGCERKRERFCLEKSKKGCPTADQHGIETQKRKCEKDECNDMRGQFNKYEAGQMDMVGGMYDFDSVMHYGNYAFSKNRKPTMLSIKDPNLAFGRYRPTLSKVDIVQINSLYNCKTKSGSWSSWTGWGPCDLGCERKRERFCLEKSKKGCPTADQHGIETQKRKCEKDECNVTIPGHWGRWGTWARCSRTCGHGYTTRSRMCNNPKPRRDGKVCDGPFVEAADCMMAKECRGK